MQRVGDRRAGPPVARQVGDGIRLDLEAEALLRRLEPHDRGGERCLHDGAGTARRRHRDQKRALVLPLHVPHQVEAPDLFPAGSVAQRLEREGRLDRPAAREAAGAQLPDRVPVPVEAALVGHLAVEPPGIGVDAEVVAAAAVVERVEQHADVLTGDHVLAVAADVADDPGRLGRRVPAADAQIEVVVVEEQPDFGLLSGRQTLRRLLRDETRRRRHLAVHGVVEAAVDVEIRYADGAQRGAPLGVAVDDRWRDRRRRSVDGAGGTARPGSRQARRCLGGRRPAGHRRAPVRGAACRPHERAQLVGDAVLQVEEVAAWPCDPQRARRPRSAIRRAAQVRGQAQSAVQALVAAPDGPAGRGGHVGGPVRIEDVETGPPEVGPNGGGRARADPVQRRVAAQVLEVVDDDGLGARLRPRGFLRRAGQSLAGQQGKHPGGGPAWGARHRGGVAAGNLRKADLLTARCLASERGCGRVGRRRVRGVVTSPRPGRPGGRRAACSPSRSSPRGRRTRTWVRPGAPSGSMP